MSDQPFSLGRAFINERGLQLHSETDFLQRTRKLRVGEYELWIVEWVKRRTLKQNAFLHSKHVLPALADHLGCSVKEVKLLAMGECFGWKQIAGHEVPVKPHTSEMDVEECKFFIDWLIPWAAMEHQCLIPLPNESLEDAA